MPVLSSILAVLSYCTLPAIAVFCWLPFLGFSSVLFWFFCLSFPGVLAVLSWPTCLGGSFQAAYLPVLFLDVPSWLSCPDCPLLAILSWLSFPGFPVLAVPSWLTRPGCPVLAVLP